MNEGQLRDWTRRLASAIADAIREYSPTLTGSAVVMLAIDCHPWNGLVNLALLTADESVADPLLADPAEMAAWHHNCFSRGLAAWNRVGVLCGEMRAAYEAAPVPESVAEEYFHACARAMVSAEVMTAVQLLKRSAGFRFTVTHPDTDREFVAAGTIL